MRILPSLDPETREDILEHIGGYVFNRVIMRGTAYDEPIRTPYSQLWAAEDRREFIRTERKRSVRR